MAARGPPTQLDRRDIPRHRTVNSAGGPPPVTSQMTCPNERNRAIKTLIRCKGALYRRNFVQPKRVADSRTAIRARLDKDRDKAWVKIPTRAEALFRKLSRRDRLGAAPPMAYNWRGIYSAHYQTEHSP